MYIETAIYGGLGFTFGSLTGIINTAPSSFTRPRKYADYNYVWAIPEAVEDFICTCLDPNKTSRSMLLVNGNLFDSRAQVCSAGS